MELLGLLTTLLVIPFWLIFRRAGMSPFLALLALIPGVGSVLCVAILAFGDWKSGESRL